MGIIRDLFSKKKNQTKEDRKKKLERDLGYTNTAFGLLIFLVFKDVLYFLGSAYTKGIVTLIAIIILTPWLFWERNKLKEKLKEF